MFDKKYSERLQVWRKFRESLETSNQPIDEVLEFYKCAPWVSMQVDPWDTSTWLGPWELMYENKYCEFSKILAICYTLQLTERFMADDFEIHICTDNKESSTYYLLFFQDKVIGYDWSTVIHRNELPSDLQSQQHYLMPPLQ
jgi:hypothetical protein